MVSHKKIREVLKNWGLENEKLADVVYAETGNVSESACYVGDKYIIKRYIQSINPVSAIALPVEESFANSLVAESKVSNASNFYKRCFMLDVRKTWFDYLAEETSEWLIIDMATVRCPIIKVNTTYISDELLYNIRRNIESVESNSAFEKIKNMDIKNASRDDNKRS